MISGALGAGWLIGLWVAAPIFGRARGAARIAQAIALGCLIPLALGALNLLYAWSLWIVLAGVAIASLLRQRHGDAEPAARGEVEWDLLVGFVALVALAWPVAVRPLLDGDTLIYHLPNAASWANQHGFWTTGTRYWWYPPASEIFASGLLATGGIGAVGWAGLPPAVLLLLTFRAVARRSGTAPIVGTLVACALLATPVAVQQLVSLQNDLWLSALFIFAVTEYATPAFAVLSLTKPTGLAFALLASGAWRGTKRRIAAAVSAGAFALWGARDLILAPRPLSTIAAWLPKGGPGSTIAAHLPESLLVFARASWHEGPAWCAFSLLGFAVALLGPRRYWRFAAFAAIVIFALLPTAYVGADGVQQLALGSSLRFMLPAATLGALWLSTFPKRAKSFVVTAAAAATVAGVAAQWQIFSNDSTTHNTPFFVAAVTLVIAISVALRAAWARIAIGTGTAVLLAALAGGLALSHPKDYITRLYGDAPNFISRAGIQRVLAYGLPAGAFLIVDPTVLAFDGDDWGTCEQARKLGAVIAIGPHPPRVLDCGRVLYRDARTTVLDPISANRS